MTPLFKKMTLFLWVFALSLFTACKSDDESTNADDQAARDLFAAYQVLEEAYDKFFEHAGMANGNPHEAIQLTNAWLKDQEGVLSTVVEDSIYIKINNQGNINTSLYFDTLNEEGNSQYRGSGAKGVLENMRDGSLCANVIENKSVLLFNAQFDSNPEVLGHLNASDQDLEVTVLSGTQCTPEILETFSEYGLVILNTHGQSDGFMIGPKITFSENNPPADYIAFRDAVIAQLGEVSFNRMLTGRLDIGWSAEYNAANVNWWVNNEVLRDLDVYVTSKFIMEAPPLSNTIVFGNMCFSGWTEVRPNRPVPIANAFLSLNPASYYGYARSNGKSYSVEDLFARQMEDSLIRSLVIVKDSTGIAHLKTDNTEYNDPYLNRRFELFFKHFNSPSWCYGECADAFTDPRDGQEYQTVCIGEQRWMAQNLNWDGAGVCYENNNTNCQEYGRLYTIAELTNLQNSNSGTKVQGLCPDGWHVPSKAELQELIDFAGGTTAAADKLRSTNGWPTSHSDEFGFGLLPGGHYYTDGSVSIFRNLGEGTKLWTSTTEQSGFFEALNAFHPGLNFGPYTTSGEEWSFACRCIED